MNSCIPSTSDKPSIEYQRFKWQSMEKTITGLVRRLNISNIRAVADEIMKQNLVSCRGPFCSVVMRSQFFFPKSSHVYAAFVAVINSRFPDAGLLLVKRAVLRFRGAYDAKDKKRMIDASMFLAHLVNQAVVYEVLAFDVMLLLLGDPSSDNVHVAVKFCAECGATLLIYAPHRFLEVFKEFRRVLRDGGLEKRVRSSILRLFMIKRSMFKRFRGVVVDGLELVAVEDRVTHEVSLLHDIHPETSLDEFKPDLEYDECEMFGRMTIRCGDSVEDDEVSSRAP